MTFRHTFHTALLCSVFLIGFGASALADELNATSHVAAATVFPDRALVTREAKVHVTAGAHTVVISDAPAGLDEASLRVAGKADVEVKIGSVEVKRVFLTEASNAAERDKHAQLQAKMDEKDLIQAQINALTIKSAFIQRITQAGAEKTGGSETKLDFSPEKWAQGWDLVQAGMSVTLKEMVTQQIALRKTEEEVIKLNQELAQIRSAQAKERRDIHVQIEAQDTTELQLSLTYQTFGARWTPVYDARLDTNNGALALEQYGQTSQQTGEDWAGVELTLSTAQPAQGSEMPGLGQWIVQLFQARLAAPPAMHEAPGGAVSPYFLAQAKKASRERDAMATGGSVLPTPIGQNAGIEEAEPVPAIAQISEYAAEFKVPGKVDLKSTNDPTKLFIATAHMTATLNARLTPRLLAQAYLFAKAENKDKYPLVGGLVAKYRDGAFIGNAAMPMLRPNETLNLSFGVDDRIKVSYRRTREEQNNPTLILVGDMTIEREYETKIQNLHKDPIEIMLFEQYPVSGDPDVKAELIEDTTTPGYGKDPDNRQGIIVWTTSLKPQEEKAYTIGFHVKYPKDRQLIGL